MRKTQSVIKSVLAKVTYDQPDEWDRYLQPVFFAIHEMPNKSIGMSPFEILYGSNPHEIMDIYKDLIIDKNLSNEAKDVYSSTVELRERLVNSGLYAKQALEKSGKDIDSM